MSQIFQSCFDDTQKMLPLAEAQAKLLDGVQCTLATETCDLKDCLGRVLGEDVFSDIDIPPHNNSAMDGYAFAYDDLSNDQESALPILGRIAAGDDVPDKTEPGAYRIFTGAAMPRGCDTVVMQENVTARDESVFIPKGAVSAKGANCRLKGEDIKTGQKLLSKGKRLDAFDIAACAAVGRNRLTLYRPLRVAIFSTGNEIQDPGEALRPSAIYDINRYSLQALLKTMGCEVMDLGILPDDPALIREALDQASQQHDLVMTSGGVSVGEEDHIKACVEDLGKITFWRVAIKPGRPVALGLINETPFVGLPGNPVASAVTFMMLARPLILRLCGREVPPVVPRKIPAAFRFEHKAGRHEWQRAFLRHTPYGPVVELFHSSGSGMISSLLETDGLVALPAQGCHIETGDLVDFIPYSDVTL